MRLFLGNIPYSWSDIDVAEQLSLITGVDPKFIAVNVRRFDDGKSKGAADLDVENDVLCSVLLQKNGVILNERKIRIQVWKDKNLGRGAAKNTGKRGCLPCKDANEQNEKSLLGRGKFYRSVDVTGCWPVVDNNVL